MPQQHITRQCCSGCLPRTPLLCGRTQCTFHPLSVFGIQVFACVFHFHAVPGSVYVVHYCDDHGKCLSSSEGSEPALCPLSAEGSACSGAVCLISLSYHSLSVCRLTVADWRDIITARASSEQFRISFHSGPVAMSEEKEEEEEEVQSAKCTH